MIRFVNSLNSRSQSKKVFIFWGQSNMNGQGDIGQLIGAYAKYAGVHSNIQIYGALTGGVFQDAEPGVNMRTTFGAPGTSHDFGPELSFLYDMAEYYGETVYGIKYGYPGSPLKLGSINLEWNIATPDECYNTLFYKADLSSYCQLALAILRIQYSSIQFKAMIGCHGETDASEQNADYETDLNNMTTQARLRLNSNLISIYNKLHINANYNPVWVANIRNAQQAVADNDSKTHIINIDALGLKGDSVHFTSDTTVILGQQMAQTYINTL